MTDTDTRIHSMHEPGGQDAFHLFIDNVRDYAIFMLDVHGYVRSWNAGATRIKGYEAADILGKHFSVFYLPEAVEAGVPEHNLMVATEEGRWEGEDWRVRADGSQFWAGVVLTAVRDARGNLIGFGKVTRDLSERNIAELERKALLEAEHSARVAAEAAIGRLQARQRVTEVGLANLSYQEVLQTLLTRVAEVMGVETVRRLDARMRTTW